MSGLQERLSLGCLDRNWYPNSAIGVGRRGKRKTCISWGFVAVVLYTLMRCFPLSVLCNCFIGVIKLFSVYLIWHRKNQGRRFSFLCVYLGERQSDHKLPPGQCSVDWTDSLLPLHHACHAGWLFMYCQDHLWSLVWLHTVPVPDLGHFV